MRTNIGNVFGFHHDISILAPSCFYQMYIDAGYLQLFKPVVHEFVEITIARSITVLDSVYLNSMERRRRLTGQY